MLEARFYKNLHTEEVEDVTPAGLQILDINIDGERILADDFLLTSPRKAQVLFASNEELLEMLLFGDDYIHATYTEPATETQEEQTTTVVAKLSPCVMRIVRDGEVLYTGFIDMQFTVWDYRNITVEAIDALGLIKRFGEQMRYSNESPLPAIAMTARDALENICLDLEQLTGLVIPRVNGYEQWGEVGDIILNMNADLTYPDNSSNIAAEFSLYPTKRWFFDAKNEQFVVYIVFSPYRIFWPYNWNSNNSGFVVIRTDCRYGVVFWTVKLDGEISSPHERSFGTWDSYWRVSVEGEESTWWEQIDAKAAIIHKRYLNEAESQFNEIYNDGYNLPIYLQPDYIYHMLIEGPELNFYRLPNTDGRWKEVYPLKNENLPKLDAYKAACLLTNRTVSCDRFGQLHVNQRNKLYVEQFVELDVDNLIKLQVQGLEFDESDFNTAIEPVYDDDNQLYDNLDEKLKKFYQAEVNALYRCRLDITYKGPETNIELGSLLRIRGARPGLYSRLWLVFLRKPDAQGKAWEYAALEIDPNQIDFSTINDDPIQVTSQNIPPHTRATLVISSTVEANA